MSKESLLKIVIVGETGVGKTSILRRFGFSEFRDDYLSTIGADFITKKIELNNEDFQKTVTLQIWDTAGQERFLSLGCAFYRGADVCVIVYDVNNPDSFSRIDRWRDEFLNQVGPSDPDSFPFIIAANKVDTLESKEMREFAEKRSLNWIHTNFRDCNMYHIPVSAKEDDSIGALFTASAEMAMGKQYKLVPSIDDTIVDLRDIPIERVCMLAGNGAMHAVDCDIQARIIDFVAEVTIKHKFINPFDTDEEGVYLLPLANNELVCGFNLSINNEGHSCRVETSKELEKLGKANGSYMTREDFNNIYTCFTGTIPKQSSVEVTFKYLTETTLDQYGNIVVVVPKCVSPIISPNLYNNDDHSISIPEDIDRNLNIGVNLVMPASIQDISSPSHSISTPEIDGTSIQSSANLKQERKELELDKDFILKCGLQTAAPSRLWLEYNQYDLSCAAMAMFSPLEESTFDEEKKHEILFVIQNTKSMSAYKESLNHTLKLLLHSIPAWSLFNVISYAGSTQSAFEKSVNLNQENLEKAIEFINNLEPEDCEAELVSAVKHALNQKPISEDSQRVALIITDGYISTTENLFLEVRKHSSTTKVYAVGIYNPLGEHLVKGFARAARTSAEYISSEDRPETKIILQLKRAILPSCEDIKFEWHTKDNVYHPSLTWPNRFPDVFGGNFVQTLTIFEPESELEEYHPLEGSLEISATLKDHNMVSSLDLDMYPEQEGRMLHRLAAWKLIENHIKELSSVGENTLQTRRSGSERQVVQLATKYNLITPLTCFVAEESNVCMTKGWQAIQAVSADINLCFAHSFNPNAKIEEEDVYQPQDVNVVKLSEPPSQRNNSKGCCLRRSKDPEPAPIEMNQSSNNNNYNNYNDDEKNSSTTENQNNSTTNQSNKQFTGSRNTSVPKALERNVRPSYMDIVNLQRYEGSWELTDEFAKLFYMTSGQLKKQKPYPDEVSDSVWATGLGLCHLVMVHSEHATECELIRLKAYQWLRNNAGEVVSEVVESASTMVEKAHRKLSLSMRKSSKSSKPKRPSLQTGND
eukprot:gb/GECH01013659.1/.p1 GENE.gb/GECH01013659.1/~~gb/GECH01013659.1/.p1  ORF type:complete len:1041 (+),score=315.98 gb/GECH01013659.1/:1-3123(+)